MGKGIMKISEKKLRNIIKESINNILNIVSPYDIIDINNIDSDILKSICVDYRLILRLLTFGNKLDNPYVLKEAYGDIADPDEVVNTIVKRYHIPKQLVLKREVCNRVYVYSVVANIGTNAELIEKDMEKMGYFLSSTMYYTKIDGIELHLLQFEPMCQLQDDITDDVKTKYNCLYHWTPSYNVDSIMSGGLIPTHRNKIFNYPPRIYLIKGDVNKDELKFLGFSISCCNNDKKNDGTYTLLKINLNKIDNNVRFFYDSNSDVGIYTEHPINNECISIFYEQKFLNL